MSSELANRRIVEVRSMLGKQSTCKMVSGNTTTVSTTHDCDTAEEIIIDNINCKADHYQGDRVVLCMRDSISD